MYQRILVAVDASRGAQQALEHALALARALRASLRLVAVVDGAGLAAALPGMAVLLSGDARLLLDDCMHRTTQYGIDTSTAILETSGASTHVADAICAEATRWGAQLVVLGRQGGNRVGRLLLGSVAEAVARSCGCAVLLVHPGDAPGA